MTVVVEDPLIAGMAIDRILPLHESSRRLRALYPECPRVYGVAIMSDVSKRRWWPLASALAGDRLQEMFDASAAEMDSRTAAAQQLAATLAHAVIGRVVALVVLEGRAWDTGLENLWVHVDSEGAIDWLGVLDPTVRVLPSDPCVGVQGSGEGTVQLPSEAALTTWIAHRCHRSMAPLFAKLYDVSGGAVSIASMWHTVGTAIVVAATQVPMLAGSSEAVGMRRGQAMLDALVGFGLPVRGQRVLATSTLGGRPLRTNRHEGLAKLGQPCLY
ncbi:MAG: iron reductase [Mycobacterium sp.]